MALSKGARWGSCLGGGVPLDGALVSGFALPSLGLGFSRLMLISGIGTFLVLGSEGAGPLGQTLGAFPWCDGVFFVRAVDWATVG